MNLPKWMSTWGHKRGQGYNLQHLKIWGQIRQVFTFNFLPDSSPCPSPLHKCLAFGFPHTYIHKNKPWRYIPSTSSNTAGGGHRFLFYMDFTKACYVCGIILWFQGEQIRPGVGTAFWCVCSEPCPIKYLHNLSLFNRWKTSQVIQGKWFALGHWAS